MASLRIESLKKAFGETAAVRGIDLSVEDGEFFCLLGPPGAGKTSILRMIAGLETPDEGRIYLGDVLVNEVPPSERDVAMVFEDLALYPHMTAYENLAHPLRLRKVARPEVDARVRSMAETLHISHLLERRPETFSGGERRRVALGRALVRQPRLLLLDEPLTDLDAWLRQEMTAELKRLQTEIGQTTIYATHDFEEAVTMADRILVLSQGAIEQVGLPNDLYASPASVAVATMVGTPAMNLILCRVGSEDGKTVLFREGAKLRFRLPERGALEAEEVLAGIRPEDVGVVEDEAPGSIPASVEIVQPLGEEQMVDLRLADRTIVKIVTALERPLSRGQQVHLHVPPERVVLFDPGHGKRIHRGEDG